MTPLSYRDKLLIKLLMVVARIVSDEAWRNELETLSISIQYSNPEEQ